MIRLSLPPLPGTNTAHPAFRMLGKEPQTNISVRPDEYSLWRDIRYATFNPVAAAAIAHYWRMHQIAVGIESDDWDVISKQRESWSSIAAGSRDYDGAEIEGYTCKP